MNRARVPSDWPFLLHTPYGILRYVQRFRCGVNPFRPFCSARDKKLNGAVNFWREPISGKAAPQKTDDLRGRSYGAGLRQGGAACRTCPVVPPHLRKVAPAARHGFGHSSFLRAGRGYFLVWLIHSPQRLEASLSHNVESTTDAQE